MILRNTSTSTLPYLNHSCPSTLYDICLLFSPHPLDKHYFLQWYLSVWWGYRRRTRITNILYVPPAFVFQKQSTDLLDHNKHTTNMTSSCHNHKPDPMWHVRNWRTDKTRCDSTPRVMCHMSASAPSTVPWTCKMCKSLKIITWMQLTDWYERLWRRTMTRHANAVHSINTHLVSHSFYHSFGFIGGFWVRVKVQSHPPVALCLLSLHHIAWKNILCCYKGRCNKRYTPSFFFFFVPVIGCPPSNTGGSHWTTQESSPTLRILTAWGGSGTSGE